MTARLKDGERRRLRYNGDFHIDAERIDADTPFVIFVHKATGEETVYTDVDARELVKVLQRALSILPTSK